MTASKKTDKDAANSPGLMAGMPMTEATKLADMETAAGVSEIEAVGRAVRQTGKAQGKPGA